MSPNFSNIHLVNAIRIPSCSDFTPYALTVPWTLPVAVLGSTPKVGTFARIVSAT